MRVLVATDIAARGIDVEALGHVVNFDVPNVPEDYIHRVGRTARAELTGEAYTFVAPDEEEELRAIEKAISRRLLRVTVPDFDYKARPAAKLEVPLAERIAAIRAKKAEDRARAAAKLARREGGPVNPATRSDSRRDTRHDARPAARSSTPRDGDSPYAGSSSQDQRSGAAGRVRKPFRGGRGRSGPSRGPRS